MRGMRRAILAMALLGPAAWAQPAPQTAPPERIGPVWNYRDHQANPAEIEARERALPQTGQSRDAREVDRLYRDLTGSDPKALPWATSRDADRR